MFIKKECVAMILAGGQGSRLHVLTQKVAKPAVPFGGKYRIIDFPLSNCVNSGIDTVGVLTQYQPLILNDYIGNGQPWDLDRLYGGVHILPPYESVSGANWYAGTANAIYQNISFIERYDPEYVLILSGDHVYKMDYDNMLTVHKERGADCTIAVLEVEMSEASRFGIMNTDENGDVYEFEEKPKNPKNNLASMGIYIFSWNKLKEYLIADEKDPNSSKDFGKNIIPAMLKDKCKLTTYPFEGYWKDVGTIDSLWEANMDLLNPNLKLNLYNPFWKIYSRNPIEPPHYISKGAKVENSMVAEGCKVYGNVQDSILFSGVVVEEGTEVIGSILMPDAHVKKGAAIEYAIVGENAVVGEKAHVGGRPESVEDHTNWGVTVVGPNISISDGVNVAVKSMVERDM